MGTARTATTTLIEQAGIVAVIRLKDPGRLRGVIDALIEGGVRALEITMTVPGAIELIRQTADTIATLPNDVVDLHLIGHSRGAVVISQAALSLNANPGPRELQLGYLKMTLLDPHPARNRSSLFNGLLELNNGTGVSTIGGFSFDPRNALSMSTAVAQLQFQAFHDSLTSLPNRRLPWYQTSTPAELSLRFNIWGDPPSEIVNQSGHTLVATDLAFVPGATTVGHTAVPLWYLGTLLA